MKEKINSIEMVFEDKTVNQVYDTEKPHVVVKVYRGKFYRYLPEEKRTPGLPSTEWEWKDREYRENVTTASLRRCFAASLRLLER
jgi:hypothetical protein